MCVCLYTDISVSNNSSVMVRFCRPSLYKDQVFIVTHCSWANFMSKQISISSAFLTDIYIYIYLSN